LGALGVLGDVGSDAGVSIFLIAVVLVAALLVAVSLLAFPLPEGWQPKNRMKAHDSTIKFFRFFLL